MLVTDEDVVLCPACDGLGVAAKGAKVGHWLGLMRWRGNEEPCPICNGRGEVSVRVAEAYESQYEEG